MQHAFRSGEVLRFSDEKLEQLLVTMSALDVPGGSGRTQLAEMNAALRQVLQSRRVDALRPRRGVLAPLAFILALLALGLAALQTMENRKAQRHLAGMTALLDARLARAATLDPLLASDPRTHHTVAELARSAPSLRKGSLHAWWAGEQARQIQRLEAMAKRQSLAGDQTGAALSARRADAIRQEVASLAESEKPLASRPQ